jgi:hypothetical protein
MACVGALRKFAKAGAIGPTLVLAVVVLSGFPDSGAIAVGEASAPPPLLYTQAQGSVGDGSQSHPAGSSGTETVPPAGAREEGTSRGPPTRRRSGP